MPACDCPRLPPRRSVPSDNGVPGSARQPAGLRASHRDRAGVRFRKRHRRCLIGSRGATPQGELTNRPRHHSARLERQLPYPVRLRRARRRCVPRSTQLRRAPPRRAQPRDLTGSRQEFQCAVERIPPAPVTTPSPKPSGRICYAPTVAGPIPPARNTRATESSARLHSPRSSSHSARVMNRYGLIPRGRIGCSAQSRFSRSTLGLLEPPPAARPARQVDESSGRLGGRPVVRVTARGLASASPARASRRTPS